MMHVTDVPVLYSFRRCPYAMRARMAIYASGSQVELREIVLRNKPPAMLEASPKGTVPVLILADGTILDESLDIMHWALGISDPKGWLRPEQGDLAGIGQLIAGCDGDFKYHLDRYKYASRYEGAIAENHRIKAEEFLGQLEARLEEQPFLYGNYAVLADYAIMPFIRQFANTDRAWFDTAPYDALRRWMTGLLETSPFIDVMQKYPPWEEGDAPLVFGKVY